MSNCYQDCDYNVQNTPLVTASERPQFQQPTKYDHYESFKQFKQIKEKELELKKLKEEFSKLNPKFTDFHLNCDLTKEKFEQLSTQDRQKFQQKFHLGGCDGHENEDCNNNGMKQPENDNHSLQKRKSLLVLSRSPVKCPISACKREIGVTFVLSHYLRDHNEYFGVPCEEIFSGEKPILKFDSAGLNHNENVCLGILAYGGDAHESSSRPSERGLCISNAFLPHHYLHLEKHLPILIMACQTSWSDLLENEEKEVSPPNSNNKNLELLVIWLASTQTVKPIHGTVTVYDKSMTSSRSSIMQIRDLNDEQFPPHFILKETNFLRLSHGDINILSQLRTEDIHMEIMINEYC